MKGIVKKTGNGLHICLPKSLFNEGEEVEVIGRKEINELNEKIRAIVKEEIENLRKY